MRNLPLKSFNFKKQSFSEQWQHCSIIQCPVQEMRPIHKAFSTILYIFPKMHSNGIVDDQNICTFV